ncbi:MAG: helix-turn-helix transcriptional regulator [Clostridia bacterium]|nr:helix-turn-helix transcriptional regulator [Clostridia bacterium]
MLYQTLHAAPDTRQKSERQIFEEFAAAHDLSGREREVLRLVLQDRSNKEISEALYVSESTVKFHIHNLLQKTGCKSRLALKSTYGTMHLHE